MTLFRAFCTHRANFVPFVSPTSRAGRTFSRAGHGDVVTVKPPSPLLTPKQQSLKPVAPLQPKNALNTPISHPQRRRRFQSRLCPREQRRRRFQSRLCPREQRRRWFQLAHPTSQQGRHRCGGGRKARLRHPWAAAGPGRASRQPTAHQAPLVWRAPEGPAAVPVGGGGAWPGFEPTRRAKLAARTASGRAAAHRHTQRPGPPAPGTPAEPQAPPHVRRGSAGITRPRGGRPHA